MRAEQIKQLVTIRQALEAAGVEVDRKGYACCPFHAEKSPSLKIYDKTNSFHCFGCGASGDVINFFAALNHTNFKTTIAEIQRIFGINEELDYSKQYELKRKSMQRQQEAQAKQKAKEKTFDDYLKAEKELDRLKKNKVQYSPKTQEEELHPLFIEALQKMAYAEYLAENLNFNT